jgi:hypothetical protein
MDEQDGLGDQKTNYNYTISYPDSCVEPRGSMNNFCYPDNIIWFRTHAATVYGIDCSPSPESITIRKFAFVILGILLTSVVFPPALASVSADLTTIPKSTDPLAQDNPEQISCLKTHVAYVSQAQDARMAGVISYIDAISGGEGSGNLYEIQEDYLAVAASIPVMQTADEIAEARTELQRQSRLFTEETKNQIVVFNGSTDAMREKAAESMQSMEDSVTNLKDSLWLAKESARLTVFNRDSQQRAVILGSLSKQGVDITRAANISQNIDAQRTGLQKALTDKSAKSLKSTNNGLKVLNREFRTTVEGYQTNLRIEMQRAAILAMK